MICPGNPRQDGPRTYVELILRTSSLQCNNETDRACISLAIVKFPSKSPSLRTVVDIAGEAPVRCNCMCI